MSRGASVHLPRREAAPCGQLKGEGLGRTGISGEHSGADQRAPHRIDAPLERSTQRRRLAMAVLRLRAATRSAQSPALSCDRPSTDNTSRQARVRAALAPGRCAPCPTTHAQPSGAHARRGRGCSRDDAQPDPPLREDRIEPRSSPLRGRSGNRSSGTATTGTPVLLEKPDCSECDQTSLALPFLAADRMPNPRMPVLKPFESCAANGFRRLGRRCSEDAYRVSSKDGMDSGIALECRVGRGRPGRWEQPGVTPHTSTAKRYAYSYPASLNAGGQSR